MNIGIPRERKDHEDRVALVSAGARRLVAAGHKVLIERGVGLAAGYSDDEYVREGICIAADAGAVWGEADLVVKVKEPLESEFAYFRPGLLLFTHLHLAAAEPVAVALMDRSVTGIAYETVTGGRRFAAAAGADERYCRPFGPPGGFPLFGNGAPVSRCLAWRRDGASGSGTGARPVARRSGAIASGSLDSPRYSSRR